MAIFSVGPHSLTTRAIPNLEGELSLLTVAACLPIKILHTNSFPALSGKYYQGFLSCAWAFCVLWFYQVFE